MKGYPGIHLGSHLKLDKLLYFWVWGEGGGDEGQDVLLIVFRMLHILESWTLSSRIKSDRLT